MSSWCCFTLGLWHSYKQANLQLWRLAAPCFIAPFWHACMPGAKFYIKPRLKIITTFFNLFRLAYPAVKDQLAAALVAEGVQPHQRQHLRNLYDMLEWWIPQASWSYVAVTHSQTQLNTLIRTHDAYIAPKSGTKKILIFFYFLSRQFVFSFRASLMLFLAFDRFKITALLSKDPRDSVCSSFCLTF